MHRYLAQQALAAAGAVFLATGSYARTETVSGWITPAAAPTTTNAVKAASGTG